MGIYDREYYQDENASRGFQLGGKPRMMVTNIVVVTVAIFIIDMLAGGRLSEIMKLDLVIYRTPWKCYQLLTYGFVHGGPWHIAMNMFMLWMFGRVIEDRLGKREFLFFYLIGIVFSGFIWLVSNYVWLLSAHPTILPQLLPTARCVVGASGGVVAVFIVFVLYYPRQTVYFLGVIAMPVWVIGAVAIGWDVLRAITGSAGVTAWQAHLGGAAFAFLYLKSGINFCRLLPAGGSMKWKLPRKGPKLRIHDPEVGDELAASADEILDKVHRDGEESLTGRERRILEKYSRQMRNRRDPD